MNGIAIANIFEHATHTITLKPRVVKNVYVNTLNATGYKSVSPLKYHVDINYICDNYKSWNTPKEIKIDYAPKDLNLSDEDKEIILNKVSDLANYYMKKYCIKLPEYNLDENLPYIFRIRIRWS